MFNRRQVSPQQRPAKWTWLELLGLSAAFFLIIWPAINVILVTVFPPVTQAQTAGGFSVGVSASRSVAAPGDSVSYTVTLTPNGDLPRLNSVSFAVSSSNGASATFVSNSCDNAGATKYLRPCNTASASLASDGRGIDVQLVITFTFKVTAGVAGNTLNGTATVNPNGANTGTFAAPVVTINGGGNTPDSPTPVRTPSTPIATTNPPATTTIANTTAPATTTIANTTAPVTTAATTAPATTAATSAPATTAATSAPATTAPATTVGGTTAPGPGTTVVTTVPGPGTPSIPDTATPPGIPYTPNGSPPANPTQIVLPTSTPTATPVDNSGSLPGGAITPVVLPTRSGPITPATATPTPTPTNVSGGGATVPTNTPSNGVASVGSGVIAGVFNGSNLAGTRVDLVLRGGGADTVAATAQVVGGGQYSFLSVRPTLTGQSYYIRYSNPNGGGTLRSWISNAFVFGGGRLDVAAADLSDVVLGNPGSADITYQLPLTLNWSNRIAGDSYSISIYRSDGSGLALNSGNLGTNLSYTIGTNALPPSDYFALVNVVNANGTGISQRQFRFRIAPGVAAGSGPTAAPGRGGGQPAPTNQSGALPTVAPTPAPFSTRGGSQSTPTSVPGTLPISAPGSTAGASSQTTNNNTPVVAGVSGTAVASASNTGAGNSDTTGTLPPGTSSLPKSGGELPIGGLGLAAFTLGLRRFRLKVQGRRA